MLKGILAVALLATTLALLPGAAGAAPKWETCLGAYLQLECGTYSMPLDRTGKLSGTTTVRAIRQPAVEGPRMGTMFVIAGGPGQSSLAMLGLVNSLFAGANRYDIIAVDQRGSGTSEPLLCPRLELGSFKWNGADPSTDGPFTDCSVALGAPRAAYNTAEAVEDLEAIRSDLAIENATFFGVSYGTKVALAYAKAHPSRTKSLLLDSVLPTDMPDAFDVDNLAALRESLKRICAAKRCNGIGSAPIDNTAKLAARLLKRPIPTYTVSPTGKLSLAEIDADALYAITFTADLDPWIYSQLPGTLSSALSGNTAQLQRLFAVITGSTAATDSLRSAKRTARLAKQRKPRKLTPSKLRRGDRVRGREMIDVSGFSNTMFYATTCADFAPPWQRSEAVAGRQAAIDAGAAAIPAASLRPFPRTTVSANSTSAACRGWQQDPDLPAIGQGPLPEIPTLALAGALDVRTPTSWARKGVAGDSLAQQVSIPNVGHSTIGTDLSGCALSLATRFLIFNGTDGRCKRTSPAIPVAPRPAKSLASVVPARGGCRRISGARCHRALKVLTAGYLALRDTLDQIQIGNAEFGSGLYGGVWELDYDLEDEFSLDPTEVTMLGVSAVPGVFTSGTFSLLPLPRLDADLRIGGYRVEVSGHLAYDRAGDSLTVNARRGRTSAHIRIRPRSRMAAFAAPTRAQLALRRNYARAVGPPVGSLGG